MDAFFDASSYEFSWFAVPVIVVGGLNWVLGTITLWRERASAPSLSLLFMTLVIGIWLLGLGGGYLAVDEGVARAWIAFSMIGTVLVPVGSLLHAAVGSGRLRALRAAVLAGVVCSLVLVVLALATDWLIADVHAYFWGYYPLYGPLGPVLMGYYAASFVIGGLIYRSGERDAKSATGRGRMRLRRLALAVAIPASIDFLPTMHVGVYPFGYAFILAYISISATSISKYRLVDITPALAAKQIIDTMTEGLLVVDRDGVVRVANDAARATWSMSRSLVGMNYAELDARWSQDCLGALLDPSRESEREVTYYGPDGEQRTVEVSSSRLRDHRGEWVGTVYIVHDITERWRAELAVRQSEERFRSLVQHASDLITVIDPDTTVRYQSPAVERILGYPADMVLGLKLIEGVHDEDKSRFVAAISDLISKPDTTVTGEGRVRDRSGEWRYLEFTGTDQRDHPAIRGIVLNVRDVTERKMLEEQLRHQALHDPLTQLANRTRFTDRLEHAVARSARTDRELAVLFMDLDNFKGINDSLGHTAGDMLLVQVAERLTQCLRPGDTVARLGGDEFAMLLEDVHGLDDVTDIAGRILEALHEPFALDGKEVVVRGSIGVAVSGSGMRYDAGGLLRDADIAMYVAKSHGKNCFRVFEPTMQVSMMERLELLADLPRALEERQFILHYQPMFEIESGQLVGVEALIRWQHPRRGMIPPAEFIPLAEESGAILSIGAWVLEMACRQGADWQRKFPTGPDWTISVNVSVKQLQSAGFVHEVEHALRESGFAPERLILEITESVMMQDVTSMLKRLHELKELGIRLAIDDFGTGFSSLSYLRDFPFDLLKIDKAFIDDLGMAHDGRDLTHAIVELGKTLDMELVAEGIERGDQLARLQGMECDLGQGFYFARPMERSGVEALLRSLSEGSQAA